MDKVRFQILASAELVARIDDLAKYVGVSRSTYCAMALSQYVMSQDKALELVEKIGTDALNKAGK